MDPWPAVSAYLARHHGLIDRVHLAQLGVRRGQIARWVAAGRLERCAPRVWRLVGSPATWEQRLQAGLLSLGPAAAVSHAAAAALHGLDRWPPGPTEFLVPRGSRHTTVDATVHSSRQIGRADVVTVRGLRTTAATRTIIDLAGSGADRERLAAAIDSAVRLGLSAPVVVTRRLDALGRAGRRGLRTLDALLNDAGGHTMLEREFLRLVRDAGLPRPTTQAIFRDGERTIARVDFLFERERLVVEVGGQLGHSSPAERARDAHRRNELQDLGFDVYEFTWEQITRCPAPVIARLATRLRPGPRERSAASLQSPC